MVSDTATRLAAIRCADVRYLDRKAIIVNYAADQSGGSGLVQIVIIVAVFALIYFMMIRPQQRRRREVQDMQSQMGIGDEIVTVGGLYGIVTEVDDDTVLLEIAPGVTAKYARAAIGKVNRKADAVEESSADDESAATPDAD